MRKVILFGVFDMFHFGHLRLLQRASKIGDYLMVGVQEDDYVARFKPPGAPITLYSTAERCEMIHALRVVDEVFTFGSVADAIKQNEFDVLVVGPDQKSDGVLAAIKWSKDNNKEIITLPRTDGISSTYLKRIIADLSDSTEDADEL
jgi:glycerol-3-phosphate cytidylyltransferase